MSYLLVNIFYLPRQINFSKKAVIGARVFYVSNISFVNNEMIILCFIVKPENLLPMQQVQVWEQRYDYKQSKYIKQKTQLYKTDANGISNSIIQQKTIILTRIHWILTIMTTSYL